MIIKKELVKKIDHLEIIADNYKFFIIDLWGVIHNGLEVFPGIIDMLEIMKLSAKDVYFLTNAPRRSKVIVEQLNYFGIKRKYFKEVISSGEVSWRAINERKLKSNDSLNCFHIGPPRDDHLIEGLNLIVVDEPQKADFILNTGPWGDDDKLENYTAILDSLLENKIPMICSNPDKEVIRGNNLMICAGTLANYYEQEGGEVSYYGKPFPEVYEYCFKLMNNKISKKDLLIIGDSLDNDIKGANNQNCDSLFITSGIHRDVNNNKNIDLKKLNDLIRKKKIFPTYAMYFLKW